MNGFRAPTRRRPFRGSVLLLAGLIVCAWSATGAAQSVWELTPYRVQLIVAFQPSAEASPRLRAHLREGLLDRIETIIGVGWEVTPARATPPLRHQLITAPESITLEDLPDDSLTFDKVMLVGGHLGSDRRRGRCPRAGRSHAKVRLGGSSSGLAAGQALPIRRFARCSTLSPPWPAWLRRKRRRSRYGSARAVCPIPRQASRAGSAGRSVSAFDPLQ